CQLVLSLHKNTSVFRQLAAQYFHDRRPRRDRVTGSETHSRGDQSVGEGLVAIHRNLRATTRSGDVIETIVLCQDVSDWIRVASLKSHQRRVHDALVFAGKFFADQSFQLVGVEVENLCDQSEDENVFTFVLGRATQRFDGETGDGYTNINKSLI